VLIHNFPKLSLAGAFLSTFWIASQCLMLPRTALAQDASLLVNVPLNDGSGRVATDVSGHGLSATLINNATWTTGVNGGAINFDGNSLLQIPGSGLSSITSGVTVAAWVNRAANYGTWQVVASRQIGTGSSETFWLGYLGGNYRWFVNTSAGYSNVNVGGAAPLNQWVHMAGTYDGSYVRLYINGVQQFAEPHRGTFTSQTAPVTVGASYNDTLKTPAEGVRAKMDNFRLYNRALSAAEIAQLAQVAVPATVAPTTTAKIKILPLGASETYGYIGPSTNPANLDGGYRRFLWEKLLLNGMTNIDFVGSQTTGLPGIDANHEGHNGWATDLMSNFINGWMSTFTPDVVLLIAGPNDLIQGAGPATALARMGTLLNQIHAARPTTRILVATLWLPRTNNDYPGYKPAEVLSYNAGLPAIVNNRISQGWNVKLVDLANLAALNTSSSSLDYGIDGLHPSAIAYKKFADVWYSAITGK
jgi:acyl-CoA thioesterase-1